MVAKIPIILFTEEYMEFEEITSLSQFLVLLPQLDWKSAYYIADRTFYIDNKKGTIRYSVGDEIWGHPASPIRRHWRARINAGI